jgi:hypothetical protein
MFRFTEQQIRVLGWIGDGMTARDIARAPALLVREAVWKGVVTP